MKVAVIIWIIDLVLLFSLIWLLRLTVIGHRARSNEQRVQNLNEARAYLSSVPEPKQFADAWSNLIAKSPLATKPALADQPLNIRQMTWLLHNASSEDRRQVNDLANQTVTSANSAAELFDDGLVRPLDLVEYDTVVTPELITSLALAEPFVWCEALVNGRGRWGFRALQLRRIFNKLRANSSDSDLRERIVVQLHNRTLEVQSKLGWVTTASLRLKHRVISPSINARSKIRQKEIAAKMQAQLSSSYGIVHAALTDPDRPEAW